MLPKTVQVVLFSATFGQHIRVYASKFAPNANEISLKQEELTVEGIKQFYLDCADDNDKYSVLVNFYGLMTVGSSIIFVQVSIIGCPMCSTVPDFVLSRLDRRPLKSRSA
jgi:ATP-dependent RNA helicase DDX19/DBP5